MQCQKLTILDLHTFTTLNEYIHMANYNKHVANKAKQSDTAAAYLAALGAKNKKELVTVIGKADIIFNWYTRDNSHDPDNVRFIAKAILDGLVKANVLVDDSRKYINGFIDKFYIDAKNPRVEIEFITRE